MTTIDFNEALIDTRRQPARRRFFARLLAAFKKRRRKTITMNELSRLDAHLLRDIGIEPMDVYDALNQRRGISVLFDPLRRTVEHE